MQGQAQVYQQPPAPAAPQPQVSPPRALSLFQTHTLSHSLTLDRTISITHSHLLALSLSHFLTLSRSRPLTVSLCHPLTFSLSHSPTLSPSHSRSTTQGYYQPAQAQAGATGLAPQPQGRAQGQAQGLAAQPGGAMAGLAAQKESANPQVNRMGW